MTVEKAQVILDKLRHLLNPDEEEALYVLSRERTAVAFEAGRLYERTLMATSMTDEQAQKIGAKFEAAVREEVGPHFQSLAVPMPGVQINWAKVMPALFALLAEWPAIVAEGGRVAAILLPVFGEPFASDR